ncbi:MAG: hypothetical protein DRP87_13605 [Spirochaetes bacterium]|nr:MAG: hypothetical protein DRP87_13605 [Spirochaetota bacterium]
MGFSLILKEGAVGKLNQTQGEYVQDILNSSKHLLSLINDVPDFSRIEAGKLEIVSEPIDLRKIVYDITRSAKPRAREKGLDFQHGVFSPSHYTLS